MLIHPAFIDIAKLPTPGRLTYNAMIRTGALGECDSQNSSNTLFVQMLMDCNEMALVFSFHITLEWQGVGYHSFITI